jgi:hypothetical protein
MNMLKLFTKLLNMPSPQEQPRDQVWKNIASFFAGVEQRNPELAKQLLPMIMGLIGNQTLTPEKLQQIENYLDVGFSVLGDWLKANGYGGFSLNLSLKDKMLKTAASAVLTLPGNRNELLNRSGIPQKSWNAVDQEVTFFSTAIRQGLEFGFTPKMIVGGLLYNSTLHQPDAYTSNTLKNLIQVGAPRQMGLLNQTLHSWIYR